MRYFAISNFGNEFVTTWKAFLALDKSIANPFITSTDSRINSEGYQKIPRHNLPPYLEWFRTAKLIFMPSLPLIKHKIGLQVLLT